MTLIHKERWNDKPDPIPRHSKTQKEAQDVQTARFPKTTQKWKCQNESWNISVSPILDLYFARAFQEDSHDSLSFQTVWRLLLFYVFVCFCFFLVEGVKVVKGHVIYTQKRLQNNWKIKSFCRLSFKKGALGKWTFFCECWKEIDKRGNHLQKLCCVHSHENPVWTSFPLVLTDRKGFPSLMP